MQMQNALKWPLNVKNTYIQETIIREIGENRAGKCLKPQARKMYYCTKLEREFQSGQIQLADQKYQQKKLIHMYIYN